MNTTIDGKITLTKKDRKVLEEAPKLAALIACLRPAVFASAERIKHDCDTVLWSVLKEEPGDGE